MKNLLLNVRQFKALTISLACLTTLGVTLPVTSSIAAPAYMLGVAAAPTVTGFSPASAPIGSQVTITGTNFVNVTDVKFNNTSAITYTVNAGGTQIIATVPNGATSGSIRVTADGNTASSTSAFTPYVTWNGGTGDWHVAANWGNNEVPTQTTNVIINNGMPSISTTAACNDLTIQPGVVLNVNSGSTFSVSGLFINSGSYAQAGGETIVTGIFSNQNSFSQTGGTINFASTAPTQNLPALTYYNLTISGSGQKVLQNNATVINTLNIVSSNLKTLDPSHVLTLNGTISGEDTNHSFIGTLVKTQTVSAAIPYDDFGNIGILFTNTGGGNWGNVTATRVTGQAITSPADPSIKSINRYWTITPTNPNTNTAVSLTLTWLSSELNGLAFTNGQAQAWRKEASETMWTPVDIMKNIVSNGNERSITVATNTFSTWAITDQMNPLPVTMTYFKGKATEAGSQLNWATASEENSASFVIERSLNGKDFEKVGTVKAAGTSNQSKEYAFTDRTAKANATNYYRLRQVDLDGTFAYSATVAIANTAKELTLAAVAYPNPFNENLNLKLNTAITKGEVTLKTIEGKEVFRQVITEGAPVNHVTLKGMPKLQSGFYILSLVVDNKTTILKVAQQ